MTEQQTQQNQSYIPLDSVITDYLTESEQSNHKYFKLWHLAFRGMENLGLDFFYKVKSVKIPINANMTVYLPPDYLNWTKVGILNDTGGIIPLYYNPNLTTYADLREDRLDNINDPQSLWLQFEWGVNTWCNYWDGYGYVNVYGVSSGEPFVGNFKIDTENSVIVLNERFDRDYVMLEYVASPVQNQEYYLPVQFREALIAWLAWKDSKAVALRKGYVGISRDLSSDFYRERRNAISRWKPSRIMDKYQTSQELTRLAIKT